MTFLAAESCKPLTAEEGSAAEKPCDRDRRHLPVPLDAGVDEKGDVASCGGRARAAEGREQRRRKRQGEQTEPDKTQLGERLEVEAVGVQDRFRDRLLFEPRELERPRAPTGDGRFRELFPGDVPVPRAA